MKTKHIIVLMLENRSFDHMLGFLNHTSSDYPKLRTNQFTNLDSKMNTFGVNADATRQLAIGPGHHFKDIAEQTHSGKSMVGFVKNYEKRLFKKIKKEERKLKNLNRIIAIDKEKKKTNSSLITSQNISQIKYRLKKNINNRDQINEFLKLAKSANYHGKVMSSFKTESKIPVLATLAKEFCVFTNWYSSVPGMTWPNRAFAHAATSNGEVDIKLGFYKNRTIFEDISDNGKTWAVYHDGPTHLWVYPALWSENGNNFRKLSDLFDHIEDPNDPKNPLPDYIFVEPNHGLLKGPLFTKLNKNANSQHPKNNTGANIDDFIFAEKLMADIYNKLKENFKLFKETLFLVTYDEHGGFFDHVIPPKQDIPAPDNRTKKFKFDRLGVRVPAVLISPWIKKGTINDGIFDHTSIIKTVRKVFIPKTSCLNARERWAEPFNKIPFLKNPRHRLPDVKHKLEKKVLMDEKISIKKYMKSKRLQLSNEILSIADKDDFAQSLVDLAANVERVLNDQQALSKTKKKKPNWDNDCCKILKKRITTDRDLANYLEDISERVRYHNL